MNAGGRGQHDPSGPDGGSALDAYVDGLMPPAERAAFERRLDIEPALAAGLAAQRRLDGSLRGLFVVPPFVGLPINGHPTPNPADAGANGNGAPLNGAAKAAVAAAAATVPSSLPYNLILGGLVAVIVTCVSLLAYNHFTDPRRSFEEVYRDPASSRFSPMGCCGESESAEGSSTYTIETACGRLLGNVATLNKLPKGIEIIGVGAEPVLSNRTVVIRAKVDGRDVVIFADYASRVDASAAKIKLGKRGGGLNVFQRQGNGLLLYEMSQFDQPRLLNLFEFPPPSAQADCPAPVTN